MHALINVSSCLLLTAIVVFDGSVANLQAKQPVSVRFDASRAVSCRVVPLGSALSTGTGTKLIEAQFRVSILVAEGKPENVEDVVVLIEAPHHRLRVVDFSPKTEMSNSVEGEVQTTRTIEKTATAGAQIGGGALPALYGLPTATLSGSEHHVVAQTFKDLPSKCLVLASGTTDGGHGVFFKVKGTPQVPLEGTKDFSCTFEVPNDWHGGWCLLACHARGRSERDQKFEACGRAEVFVGLYLEGDEAGQHIARQLDLLQLPQVANSVRRSALGVPIDEEQTAITLGRHKSFRATLGGWTNNPGFFDNRANRIAIEEKRTNVALRVTLDGLTHMSGR
jgi:hypothetical protein